MPCMRITTTLKLDEQQRKQLFDGIGDALELIPGKDRRGLIIDLEDGKSMFVGGVQQENFVFIDMRYYLKFEYHIKKRFTVALFDAIHSVLGTAKECMSMTISEYTNWGGFGDFKDEYYTDE